MVKKLIIGSFLLAILVVVLCTPKQNPYTIPGNARISLLFKDSKNNPGADQAINDTVGHAIKVGVSPFLPDFIDSASVSLLKYNGGSDSVIIIRKFSSDIDTQWFDFTFTSAKKCSVTAKAFIQGGTQYEISGLITIFGKHVSGSINPAIDTLPVDSFVTLSANVTGEGPFTYQWFHGASLLNGKTDVSLTMNHLAFVDSGSYSCLISDKWGDTATSSVAKLVIVANTFIPPTDSVKGIVGVSRFNGEFIFKWNKLVNAESYVVFRSKDTTGFLPFDTVADTTFTNVIKDTAFYYYVVAINTKSFSAPSQRIRSTATNSAPKWSHNSINVSVNEGSSYSFNCIDSCKDTNGDVISYQLTSAGSVDDSLVGTTWRYTPSYSDSGSYTVKIKAWDGTDSSILSIALHVVNVPRPPQPQPQNLSTKRNTAFQITLSAISPDGDAVTNWTIDTTTTHGTAVLASSAQPTVTYTPTTNFIGTDYFTFKASVGSLTSTYSAKVTIRVDTNNISPVISQKLSVKTLNKGDSLVLTVTVNSDAFPAPLYSWYKAGTFLDSTRINIWKKLNAQGADSGYYYVIVSNVAGRDSSGAHVSVNVPPAIAAQPPASIAKCPGDSLTLSMTAIGTAPFSYQWYLGGNSITGDTLASIHFVSITSSNAGIYTCRVNNVTAISVTSSACTLKVNTPSVAPAGVSASFPAICQGGVDTLKIIGGTLGTGASWNWYITSTYSGTAIGTGNKITVTPASTTKYYVRAEGTCGNTTDVDTVTVVVNIPSIPPTAVTAASQTICQGGSTTLSITGGSLGTGATAWKWYTGSCAGTAFGTGALVSTGVLNATTRFFVSAQGACNTTCDSVLVTVNNPPAISAGPNSQIKYAGGPAIFAVSTTGTSPMAYRWKKGSTPFGGNFPACTLSNLTRSDSGASITCTISNSCNDSGITSGAAILNVISFVKVAARGNSTLALASDGTVWGFGENAGNVLGDGTSLQRNSPVHVMANSTTPLSNVTDIALGQYHSLFLLSDSLAYACGHNDYGQLGDGTNSPHTYPAAVPSLTGVTAIAAGMEHSIFLTNGHSAFTCGQNNYGQLGIGSQIDQNIPTLVRIQGTGNQTIGIAAGYYHSLFIFSYQAVSAWGSGYNYAGQLGNGSTGDQSSPVSVMTLNTATMSMAGGYGHTLIAKNGNLYASGDNSYGELGDGTTANQSTMELISAISNVQGVAAGFGFSLILTTTGSLYACGWNSNGQLGNNSTSNISTPVSIVSSGVISIAAGDAQSAFVKNDGTLWTCGANAMGQLGLGDTTDRHVPTLVKF